MRMLTNTWMGLLALLSWATATAQDAPTQNTVKDPQTAVVDTADADRFAALFKRTHGQPTAAQLQSDYLDKGSPGIAVFTPYRIIDAAHLAQVVAERQPIYQHAIDVCLPAVKTTTAELRTIYSAYQRMMPGVVLPQVYAVFGAGNAGGSAGPGAQVIGLEAVCNGVVYAADLRRRLRGLFAHETVHTLQPPMPDEQDNDLLAQALREGVANLIGELVTGDPDSHDAWGLPQEQALWKQFAQDRATILAHPPIDGKPDAEWQTAMHRWMWNAGAAPEGWPAEAGYWIGMRVAAAYYQRAKDKDEALRVLIALEHPQQILEDSGYARRFEPTKASTSSE